MKGITLLYIGLISVISGVAAGGMMLWIGFQHNAQGEFFNTITNEVDYIYSLFVFGAWFVVVAFLMFFFISLIGLLFIGSKKLLFGKK
ncbi:MAG: hypothetical protein M3Z21_04040 [Pseudomonadota bacterium]|nr:hypothetical protein [Pseudomonadota bacterium]